MNKQLEKQKKQQQDILTKLRYGYKNLKIFKNSKIFPATIYLDSMYDNFLWIATNQHAFIVDLCFTDISFYSLQLELEIKQEAKYSNQSKFKYILLKQFNTEIPIIFQQLKSIQYSSEQNINEFEKGRKHQIFQGFQKLIDEKKKLCTYSSNFSRYFKKLRLALEIAETKKFISFQQNEVRTALKSVQEIAPQKATESLFKKGQQFTSSDVLEILKVLYLIHNSTLLQQILPTKFNNNNNVSSKKYTIKDESTKNAFIELMQLQNADTNYIIPEHNTREDLPLTDYFCFSSHNTYLTGNQITSDCKVTRYIEDLKKGIKCVELDVHNKGDNQPIITHAVKGKGFCKPITFRATIQAIDEYLQYNRDHFPLILSIQNHANRQNQDLMNNILRKQFPKNILIPNDKNVFYTLSQTKGKIIVKTSCNLESLTQFRNNDETPKIKSYSISKISNNIFKSGSRGSNLKQPNTGSTLSGYNQNTEDTNSLPETQNAEYQAFLQKIKKYKQLKIKFNQRIDQNSYLPVQKIVQITCIFKAPKGIQSQQISPFECSSIQNTKIAKTELNKIVNYTKKAWLRSYPEGTQIYSNNYEFLQILARGAQIIALNTQTNDDYAIMMNSYFRAGRKTNMAKLGYIQKPSYLRTTDNQVSNYLKQRWYYELAFYTHHQLQFNLQSIDKAKISQNQVKQNVNIIKFSLKHYNESFLIIKIANKRWIECLPLRFLTNDNSKRYRTIIGRDYEFQDTGIRIICSVKIEIKQQSN